MDNLSTIDKEMLNKIYKQIGANVKKIRKEKHCSQLELSIAIGHQAVGTVSMAELCINNKHFNIEHLAKIAKALNVSVNSFFMGVDEIIATEGKN